MSNSPKSNSSTQGSPATANKFKWVDTVDNLRRPKTKPANEATGCVELVVRREGGHHTSRQQQEEGDKVRLLPAVGIRDVPPKECSNERGAHLYGCDKVNDEEAITN